MPAIVARPALKQPITTGFPARAIPKQAKLKNKGKKEAMSPRQNNPPLNNQALLSGLQNLAALNTLQGSLYDIYKEAKDKVDPLAPTSY